MIMINKVVLIGRLTKDPELRYTQSGIAVTRFTLAVDRGFKNQDGEKQADFIPITVWRSRKSQQASEQRIVAVVGRIQTGNYDKDGQGIIQRKYMMGTLPDGARRDVLVDDGDIPLMWRRI